MRAIPALALAAVLTACASNPPTRAERLADMRDQHESLSADIAELPAGPERESFKQELDLLGTALTNLESETLQ